VLAAACAEAPAAPAKPDETAIRVAPFADYWKKGSDGTWRVAYEVNADGPVPAAAP
jgi:hypothetical protein